MGALIDQGPDVARLIAEQHIIRPIAANWLWLVHNSRGQGNDYPIRRCIHNGNRLHQILFTWMPCWMPCWMPAQLRDLLSLSVQCKRSGRVRSEEHTSELQSLMRNSYAVFCLKKKK